MRPRSKHLGVWWMIAFVSGCGLLAEGGDLRLIEAAERGDRETMASLVKEHVDVNMAQADGATALHWAAHRNDLDAAELLIRAGAQVSAANDYGVTPLSLACINRSDAMVEKLLQAGADPNSTQLTGETVLMTCARTGNLAAVRSLLTHGALVNAKEIRWEQTALMWALAGRYPLVARVLVERGADVRARSKGGFTPLLFAAQQGDMDSAQVLLAAGADVNEATPEHGNVLTVASASGNESLAIFLLEKGADPNAPDSTGITALHHAVQSGLSTIDGIKYDGSYRLLPPNMPQLVKALLAHGAAPNAQITRTNPLGPDATAAGIGMAGQTPLFLAALAGDAGILRILADNGADTGLVAAGGVTPLMAAAGAAIWRWDGTINKRLGSPEETVKVLVELGVDVNATNPRGQTAMHIAASLGEDQIIQFLAEHGAKVDVADQSGQTPWSTAEGIFPVSSAAPRYGIQKRTAELLLKLGAAPRSRDQMSARSVSPEGTLLSTEKPNKE